MAEGSFQTNFMLFSIVLNEYTTTYLVGGCCMYLQEVGGSWNRSNLLFTGVYHAGHENEGRKEDGRQ